MSEQSHHPWSPIGARLGVAIGIVIGGWAFECIVDWWLYSEPQTAFCFGIGFWPLAFLWYRIPSKVALAVGAPVALGLVGAMHWFVDPRSDAQAGIAIGFATVLVIPLVTAIAYSLGLLMHRPPRT